jgi:diguanylate cyclase (GGDEF)-like protein/PAS domain S-box-containing protein
MEFNYQDLITNLSDGLYITDVNRKITFWNKAAEKISGFTAEEVTGKTCADNILIHVDDYGNNLCLDMCPLAATIKDCTPRAANVYLHHKDGHRIPVHVKVICLHNQEGKVIGGAELFTDNSDQKLKDIKLKELEELAFLDSLTKVTNRNFINLEIENKFSEMKRYKNKFGILFFDIDHFKNFNDTYGHDLGDLVLKTVANTLKNNMRPFDLIGRWGGEEFIGIIHNVNEETLTTFGERFRFLIEKTTVLHSKKYLNVTASIGGTIAKENDTIEAIISRADKAMYKSKKNGRNKFTIN